MGMVLVPYEPASAWLVRHRLCEELASRGVPPEDMDEAVLVVSELMGNALRHARPLADGGILASWQLDGPRLEVAVADGGGQTVPAAARPGPEDDGGRGLAIVAALATEWGVFGCGEGTTVWARLSMAVPAASR